MIIFYLDCSNVIISLSPNNPSILSPQQILHNEDFSLSSTLQFHCLKSLAVIQQWSIFKCLNSLCTLTEQFHSPTLQLSLSELFLPSNTFDYGIYQMKLTVQMYFSPELISTALTYIQILPSPIQVNLVQYGPSIIIRKQQQILILDPGRFSIDPDRIDFNSTVNYLNTNPEIVLFLF